MCVDVSLFKGSDDNDFIMSNVKVNSSALQGIKRKERKNQQTHPALLHIAILPFLLLSLNKTKTNLSYLFGND